MFANATLRSVSTTRFASLSSGCILLITLATPARAAIPAGERQALLDLYSSTNGAAWINNSGGWVAHACFGRT